MEDYLSLLAERRAQAVSLDSAIVARYGNRAQDSRTWGTLYLDELTNGGINHSAPMPHEVDIMGEYAPEPLPHSASFVYRFAMLILGDPENIAPELVGLFPDFDQVEVDYLRGLTEKLKSLSIDSANTITVVLGNGNILTYESDKLNSSAIMQLRETHAVLCDDAKCRAGFSIVKHWLKRRAREVLTLQASQVKAPPDRNSSFADSLLKYKSEIVNYLTENFKGARPGQITPMLFALKDLGYLSSKALTRHTELFNDLSILLGGIGTRQALDNSLRVYNEASMKQEEKITRAKEAVIEYLEARKTSEEG